MSPYSRIKLCCIQSHLNVDIISLFLETLCIQKHNDIDLMIQAKTNFQPTDVLRYQQLPLRREFEPHQRPPLFP